MDLEKLTHHKNYGVTVAVAVGLSMAAVVVAAVAGRSTLNLKGSLVSEYVTVPVVIQLVSEAHPDETVGNVEELPVRPEIVGSSFVVTTDAAAYLIRVSNTKPWEIIEEKTMHADAL